MVNKQQEIDEAFLNFVADRGVVSALEAESLRSELKRRRSSQKEVTMKWLLVHKGHMIPDHADAMFDQMNGALSQPTLVPDAAPAPAAPPPTNDATLVPDSEHTPTGEPTLLPDGDAETQQAPQPDKRPTDKRPTGRASEGRPTDRRTTDQMSPKRDARVTTSRNTKPVEDSRSTGEKGTDGWNIHSDTDKLSQEDKMVPAGTIIAASDMTIAQMREQIGISDGVKLVSNKMDSALAQYQPDATADKKRYVVVREIARGGMGKVLEVEDTELRRSVALKVLRKELLGRRDVVERFLEEAQITGQLEHPNIVPVHEMGVDGAGNLYFTMKYVEGLSLAEVLLLLREGNRDAHRDYPLLRLLDVFIKICEGISFAHNRGVIHRDLKPANIMVGRFGEVQVMDWGVAKVVGRQFYSENDSGVVLTDRLDSGSVHTMMGAIIGTPSYMSPEQAKGEVESIDHASDTFSLGVILYEMLCLRSPWTGKSSDDVLEQVREMTPVKPRERNPDKEVPAELERLALKCLEKDPNKRVGSVKELEENVRNFIEGRAMGSVDYSAVRLAAKWVGRHRKEVAYVTLGLLAVAGGILGTMFYLKKLDQDKILGLNDDAAVLMEEWKPLAEGGDFDEAVAKVAEAKDDYQRVLAVNPGDEVALAGVESVAEASEEIRLMRVQAEMDKARIDRLEGVLEEARNKLEAGKNDRVRGDRKLREAWLAAGLANMLDRGNTEARELKFRASNQSAIFAARSGEWAVMRMWIDEMEATGVPSQELERELKDRISEWNLRRE